MDSLSKFSIERLTSPAVTSFDNSRDAVNGSQSRFCRWYPVTAKGERQDSNRLEGGGREDENSKLDEVEEGEEVVFETVGSGDERFTFFKKDGLLVGCSDRTELDNLLIRWAGGEVEKIRPLSKNRKFITIMNRCRRRSRFPHRG